jgi:hypothetical protein
MTSTIEHFKAIFEFCKTNEITSDVKDKIEKTISVIDEFSDWFKSTQDFTQLILTKVYDAITNYKCFISHHGQGPYYMFRDVVVDMNKITCAMYVPEEFEQPYWKSQYNYEMSLSFIDNVYVLRITNCDESITTNIVCEPYTDFDELLHAHIDC